MTILELIEKHELKRLSEKSDLQAIWMTVANFALIAIGLVIPVHWHHWLAWCLSAVLLGGRALGLGILVHDTAHQTLFSSRAFNEWAGKWLFGGLPNVPYHAYRQGHLTHHRHAGTEADPDLAFVDGYPTSAASLSRKFLRDVSGLNGLKHIAYQVRTFKLATQAPFLVSHTVLMALLWAAGHPEVYLCWWLGQIFVFPLVLRLRVMGEHGGVPDHLSPDPRRNTATTLANPVARLLWAPNHVNFHLEHHFAAGVPSYRLKEMHSLMASKGGYEGLDCIQPSYAAVIKRCWSKTSASQRPSVKRQARGALNNMQ
jgi:fatty acid desaturase